MIVIGNVILFLGGARSGKSALAEKIVSGYNEVAYVATAEAIDEEMVERIKNHQDSRPSEWVTFEVDGKLADTLSQACQKADAVIVDCLTIYIARRMEQTVDDEQIITEVIEAVSEARQSGKTVAFVSNEVGMGLVPKYPVGRRYRDLLGKANQKAAELADKVLFTIAGIPVDIKALGLGDL
ncbi:MAG: bifunctional adenosylcobinamide kinase/adenosylcobinamide-phosphate guanylyltransferase [Candidatus Aquicultor secundus]|nr:MAG: bifunctional adenosylcobinamide kinase/adenosylcobinamide-phosphate guanylyltransferase [Candidatus Aquicultor secundus]